MKNLKNIISIYYILFIVRIIISIVIMFVETIGATTLDGFNFVFFIWMAMSEYFFYLLILRVLIIVLFFIIQIIKGKDFAHWIFVIFLFEVTGIALSIVFMHMGPIIPPF